MKLLTFMLPIFSSLVTATKYWIDTDIGGDPDDIIALGLALKHKEATIKGVSTVNYHPRQKASIARWLIDSLSDQNIPVYPGVGYVPERDLDGVFFEVNPWWPSNVFGSPVPESKRKLYNGQGEAFEKHFENKEDYSYGYGDKLEVNKNRDVAIMLEAMKQAVEECVAEGTKLKVITIGPLQNLAVFLRKYPELAGSMTIYSMGGWFLKPDGITIDRIGYNFGVNPEATYTVINSGVRIYLYSSFLTDKYDFTCPKDLFQKIQCRIAPSSFVCKQSSDILENKIRVAEAVSKDWSIWDSRTAEKRQLADPAVVSIAMRPELIKTTVGVRVKLPVEDGKLTEEGAKVNSRNHLPEHLVVEEDPESNVLLIQNLNDPEYIRKELLETINEMLLL